ncbi:MAG: nucleotide exchange factor GrpE, partial [Elusimicrobiota bacterium]
MKKEAENESLDAKRVDNEVNSKEINASEPYDFLKIALDEKLDELQILKQSVDQQKDVSGKYYKQLLELKAEFDNYRKRVEREKRDNYNFGKEEVLL